MLNDGEAARTCLIAARFWFVWAFLSSVFASGLNPSRSRLRKDDD